MRVVGLERIQEAASGLDLIPLIEAGFVAYSEGRAVVPPVGELLLDAGEVHIKYGYVRGGRYYVVKIASGFPGNAAHGRPSGDGVMLLFDQATGEPVATLVDRGWLTDLRTAVAGAIGARHLAPRSVTRIGVLGSGTQARLQLRHVSPVVGCRRVLAWGRRRERLAAYRREMVEAGFEVELADSPGAVAARCELVVTTTAAERPLLSAAEIRPGTHINAIGSDTPDKQELDPGVLGRADLVVADSREQCRHRGEIARAVEAGALAAESVVELGDVIAGRAPRRTSDEQVTVFDSTGVAVQDLQVATAVADALGDAVGPGGG